MIKISVIVPVYNVEKYLATCLDSLYNQGLEEKDYEIILVNDGSTDNSLDICNHYAEMHSNIRICSQENQGLPAARNRGLVKAVGEWVMFVDSDDYICRNSLNYLLTNYCDNQFDCIRFWLRIRNDATIDTQMSCEGDVKFECTGDDYIKKFGLDTFCVAFLYKRTFLQNKGLEFSPVRYAEDFLFTSQFLLSNPRIRSTSSKVYQYLIHSNSLSTCRNKRHSRLCAYEQLNVNDRILSVINERKIENTDSLLFEKCIDSIRGKMTIIFSRILSSDISFKEFIQIVNRQKKMGILPIEIKDGSFKTRLSFRSINFLSAFPIFYVPIRFLYSRIFVPIILPRLDRNR